MAGISSLPQSSGGFLDLAELEAMLGIKPLETAAPPPVAAKPAETGSNSQNTDSSQSIQGKSSSARAPAQQETAKSLLPPSYSSLFGDDSTTDSALALLDLSTLEQQLGLVPFVEEKKQPETKPVENKE